ncbi:MAG TPA: hypothetical protein VHM90_12995 [Phycisphaerae bacterium]|nr:hypothetical protein [Phycisphaerae bacterium]
MAKELSMAKFDETIRHLGKEFFDWVQSELGSKAWNQAVFDVRYAGDGSYWNHKIRVATPSGAVVSLGTNLPIDRILAALNELRALLGWHSFLMQMASNGSVKVNYGYDPKSVDDPAFFDD